jgi:hypothetical protein
VENCAVDALSRRPQSQDNCYAISVCKPKWLEKVVGSYVDDAFVSDLIAKLSLDNSAIPHYSWSQGLLRYKDRIWVGSNSNLQLKLIAAMHDLAVGGHSGVPVCCRLLPGAPL